jgi:hypothetical protein
MDSIDDPLVKVVAIGYSAMALGVLLFWAFGAYAGV